MTIEAVQVISDLNENYPRANDLIKEGDDHIRMIKNALKRTFPNVKGTVNIAHTALNDLNNMMQVSSAGLRFTKPFFVDAEANFAGAINGRGVTATLGQIELVANNPFIDFHWGQTANDYNIRIINDENGGLTFGAINTGNGQGMPVNLKVNGYINTTNTIHSGDQISAQGAISSQGGISAVGNISTQSGFIASGNARIQGDLNLGTLTMNGDINNVNVLRAQAVQTAQWVHASAEITTGAEIRGGYVHSVGDMRADSSLVAENGAVYSGGVGGAQMAHDGNIYGAQWGGWLRGFMDSHYLRTTDGGRMHDWHWDVNGNVAWVTDASPFYLRPTAGSDIKLKENVKPVGSKSGYDAINSIPLVSFKYKDTDAIPHGKTYSVGFIAQDVEKIIPEAIDTLDDTKYVDQLPLITHLIAAVQHLSKKVEELEAKLEA